MSNRGFLLIEALIYLSIFALMMGGNISLFYNLLESGGNLSQKSLEAQEIDFILGKIGWLIQDFSEIEEPMPGQSSSQLSLRDNSGNRLKLNEVNGLIFLQKNEEEPFPLNNQSLKIEDLFFENLPISDEVDTPFIIKASFLAGGEEYFISRFNLAQ